MRKYLTKDAAAQLIHSFVTSRLDNLNFLLYGVPDYLIDKLQLIQNNAACIISRLQCSDHNYYPSTRKSAFTSNQVLHLPQAPPPGL